MDNTLLLSLYERLNQRGLYHGGPPGGAAVPNQFTVLPDDDFFEDEEDGDFLCDLLYIRPKPDNAKEPSAPKADSEPALPYQDELKDFLADRVVLGFNRVLFRMIDAKHMTDSEVYTRANVDRRVVSKIRTSPTYHPSKRTVTAFVLALHCTPPEAEKLVVSAGYSLSDSVIFDVIIQFCLEHRIYDLIEVDEALLAFGQDPFLPENQERLTP